MNAAFPSFSRYLPQGERSRDWQLWCTTAGRVSVVPGSPYPPAAGEHPPQYVRTLGAGRVLDEYQLIYISHGRGHFVEEGGKRHPVGEGTLLLVFPGVLHSYSPDDDTGWDEQWVGFQGPLADQLVDPQGRFDPGLHPGPGQRR